MGSGPHTSHSDGPTMHLKLFPEASFGCVLRLLLLVEFQDPILNVCGIHPSGIVWLGREGARSQQLEIPKASGSAGSLRKGKETSRPAPLTCRR